ncbi:MAG TPA: hypothetical protein VHP30_16185 [Ignavibacteriales bacterium]|nr:hypothetical protein [Ignavibacteriales bacterium]
MRERTYGISQLPVEINGPCSNIITFACGLTRLAFAAALGPEALPPIINMFLGLSKSIYFILILP